MLRAFLLIFLLQSCDATKRNRNSEQLNSEIQTSLNSDISTATDKITFEQELIGLINDHRMVQGLHPLIKDEELSFIALKHSQNMAMNRIPFGHLGFSERCAEARLVLGGGNWCAENVAMGYQSAKTVFSGWMNSVGHRQNIESSRATVTGIAYAINANGAFYWTQIFLEL